MRQSKCEKTGCRFLAIEFQLILCRNVLKKSTLPTADILSGKNARAWVSMVLYLKKQKKIKILKQNKILGALQKLSAK